MNDNRNLNDPVSLAKALLARCRQYQGDFFIPTDDMINAWSTPLRRRSLPPEVYLEAVGAFYGDPANGDRRPSIGDIMRYSKVVRDRWDADPLQRRVLDEHRAYRQLQIDRAIETKSLYERRYGAPTSLSSRDVDAMVVSALEKGRKPKSLSD